MRNRLFKAIFGVSMSVFLICGLLAAVWLFCSVPEVGVVQLFLPLVVAAVAALLLSVVLAAVCSKRAMQNLDRIDFSKPDERDVEEELKPLVRRLNEQNRQIRSQMEALAREHQRQDRIRREFTANVSHELKTPLTSISGFAELMRDGMVRPEDVSRFGGRIYEEAQRLMTLVGDIIRLSRLEDPTLEPQKEPVSLYATAELVRGQLETAAKKREVTMVLAGAEGWIVASGSIVEEIIYNLCDNAVQYNRPGGSVTITVSDSEQAASIQVADTGIGIPQEEQPRIFERFYRVDKSHSRSHGGTGLGLSIVKHGAASLGAEIRMDSALGEGTTVTVTFPKSTQQTNPDPQV